MSLFKHKWVKYVLIAIAAIIVLYFLFYRADKPEYVLAEAIKGDIVQTVSVTGSIKADPSLNLHFKKTGTVQEILVNEGDEIYKGDLLAILENDGLSLEVERMQANLNYALAQYNLTKAGSKAEEILIAQADLLSTQAALQAAEVELTNTKTSGESTVKLAESEFKKAEKDFLTTKDLAEKEIEKLNLAGENAQTIAIDSAYSSAMLSMDAMFSEIQDALYLADDIVGLQSGSYGYISQSDKYRLRTEFYLPAKADYDAAILLYNALDDTSEISEKNAAILKALNASDKSSLCLSQIGITLETISLARDIVGDVSNQITQLSQIAKPLHDTYAQILTLTTGSAQDVETLKLSYQLQIDQSQSVLDNAEYNLEQAELNTENANNNAEAFVALKQAAVDSAKATLSLRQSPVRFVDLAPLSAQISQAEIALKIARNSLADSQLYAPIGGMVTFIYGKVGENIALTETSLSPFLSIQANNLIVEANVPETDIIKINEGDEVDMTIDAFDFTEKLTGEVIYLDPAETIIQGVIYYGIKTAFNIDDPRLKSGMTANLEIITDKKENVIIIPTRAVKFEDSIRYVEVLNNGTPKKVTIQTGLESDQYVEITDGLKVGDKIITFVK